MSDFEDGYSEGWDKGYDAASNEYDSYYEKGYKQASTDLDDHYDKIISNMKYGFRDVLYDKNEQIKKLKLEIYNLRKENAAITRPIHKDSK